MARLSEAEVRAMAEAGAEDHNAVYPKLKVFTFDANNTERAAHNAARFIYIVHGS